MTAVGPLKLDWSCQTTLKVSRGYTYEYLYVPSKDPAKPVLLLCHGFPEEPQVLDDLAYNLHSQHGVGLLLPSLLGYKGTSKPDDPREYAAGHQVKDINEILEHEKIKKIVAYGRDWGSMLASRFPLFLPEKTVGLIIVCVQYNPPDFTSASTEQLPSNIRFFRERFEVDYDNYNYFRFFNTEESWHLWNKDYARTFAIIIQWEKLAYYDDKMREAFLSDKDFPVPAEVKPIQDAFVDRWTREGGFRGPLNWYKAWGQGIHRASEFEFLKTGRKNVDIPTLFYTGGKDTTCPATGAEKQREYVRDLEIGTLPNAGHMIYSDDPKGEFKLVEAWLQKKGFA